MDGVTILAFPDDVLIIADSQELLQQALDLFSVQCARLGLTINTDKCFSFHLGSNPRTCLPTDFTINQVILNQMNNESFSFLGKPVGFQIINDYSQVREFHEKAQIIIHSALTPWQKIDTLKAFFFPSLQYAQRTQQLSNSDWNDLDVQIKASIKKDVLFVPPTNTYTVAHPIHCLESPLLLKTPT